MDKACREGKQILKMVISWILDYFMTLFCTMHYHMIAEYFP